MTDFASQTVRELTQQPGQIESDYHVCWGLIIQKHASCFLKEAVIVCFFLITARLIAGVVMAAFFAKGWTIKIFYLLPILVLYNVPPGVFDLIFYLSSSSLVILVMLLQARKKSRHCLYINSLSIITALSLMGGFWIIETMSGYFPLYALLSLLLALAFIRRLWINLNLSRKGGEIND